MPARYELRYYPGFEADLRSLAAVAQQHPGGPEDHLVNEALSRIKYLRDGGHSTHELQYMASYGDISDCDTTYVGAGYDTKPSHRMIWREQPPARPGGLPVREFIALGKREYGAAYHVAAQRLGRPIGVTLEDLANTPEPIAPKRTRPQYNPAIDRARERGAEPEFG